MEKLLELEKQLREAKASLEKNMGEEVNGSFEQSEKHPDEKEDKRLIAEAIDVHNEKKHGEDKDKNSAYKDMKIKKEEGDVIKMEEVSFAKNGQWSLDKKESNLTKSDSLESKLKAHPGVKSVSVTHNHPDHPGHTYISVDHNEDADGHVHNVVSKHGKITSDSISRGDQKHNGKSVTEAQYLVKPHVSLAKGLGSKLDNAEHKAKISQALGSIRQPAKVTNAAGETKMVSPQEQVSEQKSVKANKAAEAKAKAEAEAAERRASYKKANLMKNNDQWSLYEQDLEKAKQSDIYDSDKIKGDAHRNRTFDAGRSIEAEVKELHDKSAQMPISTYKPGQKGFPPREKQVISNAKTKNIKITPNKAS